MVSEEAFRSAAGEQVRISLAIRRMSREELADLAGVSPMTVGRHIRAETPMTHYQSSRYADALEMVWRMDPETGLPRLLPWKDSNLQPFDLPTQPVPALASAS